MVEILNKILNQFTEIERKEELDKFTQLFSTTTIQIASLFGNDVPINVVNDHHFPHRNSYYIHGTYSVSGIYGINEWRPFEQTFGRWYIDIPISLQGNNYGTKITQITENLARELGAKKFIISEINNARWKKHLLKNGFRQDPTDPYCVFKKL